MKQEQISLPPGIEGGLFPSYFLLEGIKNTASWKSLDKKEVREKYEEARRSYLEFKKMKSTNEADVEDKIIQPFLTLLGIYYRRQQSLGGRVPDYVLFESDEKKNKFSSDRWNLALSLLEAKKWERALDRRDVYDIDDPYIPAGQIMAYLSRAEADSKGKIRWGILTNGRFWRLYAQRWDKRGKYLEIDFEKLFGETLSPTEEEKFHIFKIFLLFFSKDAFLEKAEVGGNTFLDYAVEEGKSWETELTENLKDRIYKEVIPSLAKGMYKSLPEGERDLAKIYEATLILLYRLLFILYAEDKGLLPPRDEKYDDYSLRKIREKIAKKMDENDVFSKERTNYYSHLRNLFDIINKGDSNIGISPYNGGLFESQSHPFLDTKINIPDFYLAIAIDHLSRDYRYTPPKLINYKDLSVAHLGSIYEGLLEFKLKVAKTNLKIVKKGGKEIYEKAKPGDTPDIYTGEIYLTNDKSERKATGSYYTPDYIVNYIVENTIGPLIEEKKEQIRKEKIKLQEKIKNARGYNRKEYERRLTSLDNQLIDEILSIKVLDPAMGSGHFLVGALNYLSNELYKVLGGEETKEAEKDYDVTWIKREVVERCLYGVDINPLAVELAKLSLWLETLSHGKPLNFLDHHLKVGNSLIGAEFNEIVKFPVKRKGKQEAESPSLPLKTENFQLDISKAVNSANLLMQISSDSIEGIKEKEKLYKDSVELALAKLKRLANLWTAIHFGLRELEISGHQYLLNENLYRSIYNYIAKRAKENVQVDVAEKFLEKADKIAEEKKFFHWELEFPEIFFDEQGKILPNPGFDVVMGNPPYVRQEKIKDLKASLQAGYEVYNSTSDLYTYFYEKSWHILKSNGFSCFISSNKWMRAKYGEKLRKFFKEKTEIIKLIDFGGYPVFEATVDTNIILFKKKRPDKGHKVIFVNIESKPADKDLISFIEENHSTILQEKLDEKCWTLADERILRLKEKIEKVGKPLKDWDVRIYFGIKTGFNKAFIINTETREKILAQCKTEEEKERTKNIIKPILRGRDLFRWGYKWAGWWLIKIEAGWTNQNKGKDKPEEFFKKTYPAVYNHLISFANKKSKGKGLLNRDDQGDYWWELRDCSYYSEFEKEKIVYPDISERLSFTYDDKYFLNNTCYFINSGNKYLLSVLNSSVIDFFYRQISSQLGNEAIRAFTIFIEQLPISLITQHNELIVKELENLVDQILSLTQFEDYLENPQKQAKVKDYERQIDQLVYKLYGLTDEEIKIVEGAIKGL